MAHSAATSAAPLHSSHPRALHASMRHAPFVIAFPQRFERAAAIVQSFRLYPPARRLPPARAPPTCMEEDIKGGGAGDDMWISSRLNAGVLSLTATHAAAWAAAVSTNTSVAVFEDDIEVADASVAHTSLRELARSSGAAACELVLLGHCGPLRRRCTHAYAVTPRGASELLMRYHASHGCAQPDDPQEAWCSSRPRACCSAKGAPGVGLYGGGIVGQNRTLAHYLHFRPCHKVHVAAWAERGCKSLLDYETPGNGTSLVDDGGTSAKMPSAREEFTRRYGPKVAAALLQPPRPRVREGATESKSKPSRWTRAAAGATAIGVASRSFARRR